MMKIYDDQTDFVLASWAAERRRERIRRKLTIAAMALGLILVTIAALVRWD